MPVAMSTILGDTRSTAWRQQIVDTILSPHADIRVIPSHVPIPGEGFLPVNAYVILGRSLCL